MGLTPPTPSYLSFIPTEGYYSALIGLTPVVLIAELLIGASFLHVAIRLTGRPSDFDQLINLVGMAALVVFACFAAHGEFSFIAGRLTRRRSHHCLFRVHLILVCYYHGCTALRFPALAQTPSRDQTPCLDRYDFVEPLAP